MAHLTQRRSQNVEGNFYVDTTYIDCDTCRWMAPNVFDRLGEQSAVPIWLNQAIASSAKFS